MTDAAKAATARHRSEFPASYQQLLDEAETELSKACCRFCCFRHTGRNECRRNAPKPLKDGAPVWPIVQMMDWCGEWESV